MAYISALLCAAFLFASAPLYGQEAQIPDTDHAQIEADTAPVQIDGEVLFRVRGVSSLQAATRARAIEQRIEAVAADRSVGVDSLSIVESDGLVRIVAGNRPIMGIAPADGRLEQALPHTLAAAHRDRIRESIVEYRADRSSAALRRAILRTAGAALIVAFIATFVLVGGRQIGRLVDGYLQRKGRSIGIQAFEIVGAERIRSAFRGTLRAAIGLMLAALAAAFLSFSLGQFPWTRATATGLVSMLIGPLQTMGQAVVSEIPNLVFLAVLFVVFRLVLHLARLFFEAVGRGIVTLPDFEAEWSVPTYKIVRFAILAFAIIVAYPYIPGSDSDAFKGVSLFVGVLFSLGSSSVIANLIAGYMMTYRRAFRIGDRVKIGDVVGDVTEQRLQVTRLRSPKNEEIIIPNSQILNGEVLNYSALARTRGLILHTEVGIGYETSWRQVEAMLVIAAGRTAGILAAPPPFVFRKRLGDFAITYELNVYCDDAQAMYVLYSALHASVLDVFNEYGVQIMTPAYEGDPLSPKVVPPPLWHIAPAPAPESRMA